jgi:hypothetical protein
MLMKSSFGQGSEPSITQTEDNMVRYDSTLQNGHTPRDTPKSAMTLHFNHEAYFMSSQKLPDWSGLLKLLMLATSPYRQARALKS